MDRRKQKDEVICSYCKKKKFDKMLTESEYALARYNKKLKKRLKEIKRNRGNQNGTI